MKRYKVFLIIIFIIMLIPIVVKMFTKKHSVEYKVDNYTVNENFLIEQKTHNYEFVISNKKEKYSYIINENINKRKKVIKEIKVYKKNNIKCILPIYKKKVDLNLYCLEDNHQVSNYYLKDNDDFKEIVEQTKKYKITIPSDSNKTVKYKNMKAYKENIMDNYKFVVWDYKGISILDNNTFKYQKFIDYDLYENIMSTIVSNYYVLFENTDVMGIKKIHYYDLKKGKYKTFKVKEEISKDSYINGVNNNLIYITDKKKKIQYTVNIKKETIEEVGKEEQGYIKFTNNQKEILNKSDFFMENQYFDNEKIENKEITDSEIVQEGKYYYFIEDNMFKRQMENGNEEMLFELENIDKWYVYNKDILLFVNDTVYLYNDKTGLRKIVEYKEFKYNKNNIIEFWKK